MKKYLMSLILIVVIAAIAIGVLLGKIEDLEMQNAALQEELAAVQTLLAATEAERNSMESELSALHVEHESICAERDTLLSEKTQLDAALSALSFAHDALSAEYDTAQAQLSELQGYKEMADALTAELAEITTVADTLAEQNNVLLSEIENANALIADYETQIEQLKGRIAILKSQIQ